MGAWGAACPAVGLTGNTPCVRACGLSEYSTNAYCKPYAEQLQADALWKPVCLVCMA